MEESTWLVSTGDCVKIWDATSMAPLEHFNPHSASHPVAQACWSSNNHYLVSASSSGDKLVVSSLKSSPVPVVDLAEGRQQTRVCLSSSSQFLVSGGLDHCVHLWDLKTRRLHRTLKDHREEVTCVSFNSNDSCVASGSTSGDLVLHSLTTNLSSRAFGHGPDQPIHDLRLSTVKRSLMGSVSDGGAVVLWDANTQKELQAFHGAHKAPGSGLAFSPSSDLLVVSVGLDKKIVCYDTASRIVLRPIRVDAPLTSVDFTLDGTGLVVGSTRGKIYQYDLRNSSAPTRVTLAHKTSVTCLRFQSQGGRHKSSSKTGSARISSAKRPLTRVSSGQPDPAPLKPATGVAGAEVRTRAAEGQQGSEPPLAAEEGLKAGRGSLDVFSPVRDDSRAVRTGADTPFGRTQVSSLELSSRECEGQPVLVGRGSLDVFSPVRDESQCGDGAPRRTHLGTPLLPPAGRCYSPLSAYQTPPPAIREEEPLTAAESCDPGTQWDQPVCSGLEGQATPPSSQPSNEDQPAPPFFTPEPGLRRANAFQAAPSCEPDTAAPSVSSALTQNIAQVVGQGAAAPLTALQIHFIQNMIHETLEELRDTWHRDMVNLQVEMIRQFYIQLNEVHGLIEKYSVNESLVEEIHRLREENRRLRTNY